MENNNVNKKVNNQLNKIEKRQMNKQERKKIINEQERKTVQIIPFTDLPIIKKQFRDKKKALDYFVDLILKNLPIIHSSFNKSEEKTKNNRICLKENDILVISHTFIAKIWGDLKKLDEVKVSIEAHIIANKIEKDPKLVQLILNESNRIEKLNKVFITENKMGIIGANSGIDRSNSIDKNNVIIIPEDLQERVELIYKRFKEKLGFKLGIAIIDSIGRPFRVGTTGIILASKNVPVLVSYKGTRDIIGNELKTSEMASGDNIASMADLIMGQGNEAIPVVLIRGINSENWKKYGYKINENTSVLIRKFEDDLYRERSWKDVMEFRHSYRYPFSNKKIEKSTIEQLVRYATLAPNAHNAQFWRFIPLTIDDPHREKLFLAMEEKWLNDVFKDQKIEQNSQQAKTIKEQIHKSQEKFLKAPLVMLFCLEHAELIPFPDEERRNAEIKMGTQSVANAANQMWLAMEGLGLVGCWYCAPLFAQEIIKNSLNLPATWEPQIFLTIGHPDPKYLKDIGGDFWKYREKERKNIKNVLIFPSELKK